MKCFEMNAKIEIGKRVENEKKTHKTELFTYIHANK